MLSLNVRIITLWKWPKCPLLFYISLCLLATLNYCYSNEEPKFNGSECKTAICIVDSPYDQAALNLLSEAIVFEVFSIDRNVSEQGCSTHSEILYHIGAILLQNVPITVKPSLLSSLQSDETLSCIFDTTLFFQNPFDPPLTTSNSAFNQAITDFVLKSHLLGIDNPASMLSQIANAPRKEQAVEKESHSATKSFEWEKMLTLTGIRSLQALTNIPFFQPRINRLFSSLTGSIENYTDKIEVMDESERPLIKLVQYLDDAVKSTGYVPKTKKRTDETPISDFFGLKVDNSHEKKQIPISFNSSNENQTNVFNTILGRGFNRFINILQNQRDFQIAALRNTENLSNISGLTPQLYNSGLYSKSRSLKEVDMSFDDILAEIAGCDCNESENHWCTNKKLQFNCLNIPVWNLTNNSALLSDILSALDQASYLKYNTIALPYWPYFSEATVDVSEKFLRTAISRVAQLGSVFVLPESASNATAKSINTVAARNLLSFCSGSVDDLWLCLFKPKQSASEILENANSEASGNINSKNDSASSIVFYTDNLEGFHDAMLHANNIQFDNFNQLHTGVVSQSNERSEFQKRALGLLSSGSGQKFNEIFRVISDVLNQEMPDSNQNDNVASCVYTSKAISDTVLNSANAISMSQCQSSCIELGLCNYITYDSINQICHMYQSVSSVYDLDGSFTASRYCDLSVFNLIIDNANASGILEGSSAESVHGVAAPINGLPSVDTRIAGDVTNFQNIIKKGVDAFSVGSSFFEASKKFFNTMPIKELAILRDQMRSSDFLRIRGSTRMTTKNKKENYELVPLVGLKKPTVTCAQSGMICCVSDAVVDKWDDKNLTPYLNSIKSDSCRSSFTSQKGGYCATIAYDDDSCETIRIRTTGFTLYRNVLTVPDSSYNNGICECQVSRNQEGNTEIVGFSSWEYSIKAVQAVEETKQSKSSVEKFENIQNALDISNEIVDQGSTITQSFWNIATQAKSLSDNLSDITSATAGSNLSSQLSS